MENKTSRRFTDGAGPGTVVAEGLRIDGEISGSTPIEIWGELVGSAGSEGLLWIRPGGRVEGEIAAADVVVEGHVQGRIQAENKIELRSSSRVEGDIQARSVAIAEGSFFEGRIQMAGGKRPNAGSAPAAGAKAAAPSADSADAATQQISFTEKRKDS